MWQPALFVNYTVYMGKGVTDAHNSKAISNQAQCNTKKVTHGWSYHDALRCHRPVSLGHRRGTVVLWINRQVSVTGGRLREEISQPKSDVGEKKCS